MCVNKIYSYIKLTLLRRVFYSIIINTLLRRVLIMRPSSPGGGRVLRRTLSVCLSVPLLSDEVFFYFTVEPSYGRTSKIEKLRLSLMASVTYVLFGTRRGPHILRPSRPHKFLYFPTFNSVKPNKMSSTID